MTRKGAQGEADTDLVAKGLHEQRMKQAPAWLCCCHGGPRPRLQQSQMLCCASGCLWVKRRAVQTACMERATTQHRLLKQFSTLCTQSGVLTSAMTYTEANFMSAIEQQVRRNASVLPRRVSPTSMQSSHCPNLPFPMLPPLVARLQSQLSGELGTSLHLRQWGLWTGDEVSSHQSSTHGLLVPAMECVPITVTHG